MRHHVITNKIRVRSLWMKEISTWRCYLSWWTTSTDHSFKRKKSYQSSSQFLIHKDIISFIIFKFCSWVLFVMIDNVQYDMSRRMTRYSRNLSFTLSSLVIWFIIDRSSKSIEGYQNSSSCFIHVGKTSSTFLSVYPWANWLPTRVGGCLATSTICHALSSCWLSSP